MATTIIAAAPTVVAEIPRRPSQYLRSLALSGVAAAAALAALVTLVLAASLGATQLFLLAALAAWVAATFGRGAVMAVRTAAGGSLVAGPSGVWFAGRPIPPGGLRFTPVVLADRGDRRPAAWPHRPGTRPAPPLSPWFWRSLPLGPLALDLTHREINQLDCALLAAAGSIQRARFVGVASSSPSSNRCHPHRPADRVQVVMAWGRRRMTFEFDVVVPPRELVLVGEPRVTPWEVTAEVAAPGTACSVTAVITPRRLALAPEKLWV